MRPEQVNLWDRIEAFDIDGDPTPSTRFADRLARENSWTRPFAERAVLEYKRFVFLTMTAGRSMCPSEQIDQVWHLHLTYTRSYWKRFCGEVLGTPLHHEPTRGGVEEGRKHWAMYSDTLQAYREAFGEEPPTDLWPGANQRFGDDLAIRKINRNNYWLIRKPRVSRSAVAAMIVGVSLTLLAGCNGGDWNPFDLKKADFLPFFLGAYLIAFGIAYFVRRSFRGPDLYRDDAMPELDAYEVAYMTGGRPRLLATALVRLKDMHVADVAADGHVIIRTRIPKDADVIELGVFKPLRQQSGNKLDIKPLVKELQTVEATRFARLTEEGLVPTPRSKTVGRFMPHCITLVPILLLGVPRLILGIRDDQPVAYLIVSMVIAFVVSGIAFGRAIKRTRKGNAVLANLSKQHSRLRTLRGELQPSDAAMAVAVFGVAVLTGTAYASMYDQMRRMDGAGSSGGCSTSTSGCSSGADGGGGGCGGGGCGGCGGGGGGD